MTVGLEIYIFDLRGQTIRQLTNSSGNAEWGDWSPDSQFLIYSGPSIRPGRPDDGGLHIIEVATGADRRLSNNRHRVYGRDPRWSPQGEPIAFWASDNVANHEVFTIRSDGDDLRRLTNSSAANAVAETPRWFNGGSHLLYFWQGRDDRPSRGTRIMRSDGS
jgi:Tol biopolymer transport system component